MICTFFGHGKCCEDIRAELEKAIRNLVENRGITHFFVGNQGSFDELAAKVLTELKTEYENINAEIVLAYLKESKNEYGIATLFPEELDGVMPKYAVYRRNMWMINKADVVIAYVRRKTGGAAKFREIAERKGLEVIDI